MKTTDIIINGTVKFAGINTDNHSDTKRNVITIFISEETEEKLKELMGDVDSYEAIPLKETEDGETYFKASTAYEVKIFENAQPSEIKFEELGRGSEVSLFCRITEVQGRKRGHNFLVAYLKSVDIMNFEEKEDFNPFVDGQGITQL